MIPSKKESVCPVCGHKQKNDWSVPMFDPPKCHKCGNYVRPKQYSGGDFRTM